MDDLIIFATIEDLNARRNETITGDAKVRAQALLEDASAKIQLELEKHGINWKRRMKLSAAYANVLRNVTCAMVDRTMINTLPGIESRQQAAGPYSFTDNFANPTGDMYLLANEKASLGLNRGRIGCLPPARHCVGFPWRPLVKPRRQP